MSEVCHQVDAWYFLEPVFTAIGITVVGFVVVSLLVFCGLAIAEWLERSRVRYD